MTDGLSDWGMDEWIDGQMDWQTEGIPITQFAAEY